MLLRSWLAEWHSQSIRLLSRFGTRRRAPNKLTPRLHSGTESLEARCLLTTIDLANLGTAGTTIYGIDANDHAGFSVSHAGDLNGDGFDDLVIGAQIADSLNNGRSNAGEIYVVFGGPSLSGTINLASLGTDGVTIFGANDTDFSGRAVSGAGDVNGDGFDDLIIGAKYADGPGNNKPSAGESYIIFGGASLAATLDLAALGTAGVTIFGGDQNDLSGSAVAGAGDVNGDGFDDIIIGARYADTLNNGKISAGESYVIFGGAALPATIDLAALGTAGITIFGAEAFDYSGSSVSGAGDVNGDGFADVIVGAKYADGLANGKADSGESYVIFGGAALPSTIDLGALGTAGFTIFGEDQGDASGDFVASAGDVNGDGFDDVIIGATYADGAGNGHASAGDAYVVFGSASPPATINLATLGTGGVKIIGIDAQDFGAGSVAGAGDVNGDGIDDLLIGTRGGDASANSKLNAGETYLIFGKVSLPATVNLATLDAASGIMIFGADSGDYAGNSVSSAGDVNGDGFGDWIIGAPYADGSANNQSDTGESYLIFGGNFTNSVTHPGTVNGETLTGDAAANVINGAAGNDTLVGNGGADVILGGEGDDTLAISDLLFRRLNGGNGSDTLRLDGSGLNLDLTAVADNKLTEIEAIDIRGSGANTLTLSFLEVLNLTANSNPEHATNTLTVRRDADDTVNIGAGWSFIGSQTIDNELYSVYGQGAATLKVTNHRPEFTSSATPSVVEDQTSVITVVATDVDLPAQTVTYGISGGADQGKFTITAGGVLTFFAPPDFENPTDADGNNIYEVVVTAEDGNGGATLQSISVTVTSAGSNLPPQFTSPATFNVAEGTTSVGTTVATDPDLPPQTVTFSITGGADAARFLITNAGVLTFAVAPDFENPTDNGGDNVYEVQVTADDGNGGTTTQNIAVTVTDVVNEGVTLNLGGPAVTWIKKQPPVVVLPLITVGGVETLVNGTLSLSVNAVGTKKKLLDQFSFPSFSSIGTSTGPQRANGQLTLEIQLNPGATNAAVQSFLRGITFSTKGKGLKTSTRSVSVTLDDDVGSPHTVVQTINVRKKA